MFFAVWACTKTIEFDDNGVGTTTDFPSSAKRTDVLTKTGENFVLSHLNVTLKIHFVVSGGWVKSCPHLLHQDQAR